MKTKQDLINAVIADLVKSIVEYGDTTSLEVILQNVSIEVLKASLPETEDTNDSI